jgi:hypothetical protein
MAESLIVVNTKNAHTWNRTIGVNSIEDEFVLPGEYPYATYSVLSAAVATATANSHMLQIMAGGTLPVRLRRITISQGTPPAAIAGVEFVVVRLTTAGTGGTVITPRPYDTVDAASGATAMTLPTVKGTETFLLRQAATFFLPTTLTPLNPIWVWEQAPNTKPIIIPAGTANGIAIKNVTALATATAYIQVEVVETNFV